jgi:hypothetical protein
VWLIHTLLVLPRMPVMRVSACRLLWERTRAPV